jgi:site-specific recombinase XerD
MPQRKSVAVENQDAFFETRNGTPFSKDHVRQKLVSVLLKPGLKRGGLHAFRHGRVSVLQENGVPGDLVKEWIGHSSLRTTSRYTDISPEFRERVAVEVGLFKPMLDPNGPNLQQTRDA